MKRDEKSLCDKTHQYHSSPLITGHVCSMTGSYVFTGMCLFRGWGTPSRSQSQTGELPPSLLTEGVTPILPNDGYSHLSQWGVPKPGWGIPPPARTGWGYLPTGTGWEYFPQPGLDGGTSGPGLNGGTPS